MILLVPSIFNKMDSILISDQHPSQCFSKSIISWNSEFTNLVLSRLEPYGWKVVSDQITSPLIYAGPEWKISIEKSNEVYFYSPNKTLFNPKYTFFFHNLPVCVVDVHVYNWITSYIVSWKEEAFERIKTWTTIIEPSLSLLPSPIQDKLPIFFIGD